MNLCKILNKGKQIILKRENGLKVKGYSYLFINLGKTVKPGTHDSEKRSFYSLSLIPGDYDKENQLISVCYSLAETLCIKEAKRFSDAGFRKAKKEITLTEFKNLFHRFDRSFSEDEIEEIYEIFEGVLICP